MRTLGSSLPTKDATAALAASMRVPPEASLAFMEPDASRISAMLRDSCACAVIPANCNTPTRQLMWRIMLLPPPIVLVRRTSADGGGNLSISRFIEQEHYSNPK